MAGDKSKDLNGVHKHNDVNHLMTNRNHKDYDNDNYDVMAERI